MPRHRMLTECGMGTSLRRQDYTEAARRALQDALWRDSINLVERFGREKSAMQIDAEIGMHQPGAGDTSALPDVSAYGKVSLSAVRGGHDVPRPDGAKSAVITNAAIPVHFDTARVA